MRDHAGDKVQPGKASCHSSPPSLATDKVDLREMSTLGPCPSNTRTSSRESVGSGWEGEEGESGRWRDWETDMAWLGREGIAAGVQRERRQLKTKKDVEAVNAERDPPQKMSCQSSQNRVPQFQALGPSPHSLPQGSVPFI